MAQNEQVRVDITADDKASKQLDQVADKVDEIERSRVEIPVDADTSDAERALRDVADTAKRIDPVEIPVDADTAAASRALEDLGSDARALTDADREIVLTAKVGDAKAGLQDLQAELESLKGRAQATSEKLDGVSRDGGGGGGRLRGQAIADLTGPLGDVSGQASDLAGVFDGLGDTLGGLGGKFGVSAEAIEGALGGIGFAVAGAVALWGLFKQSQQKAREETEKLTSAHQELLDLIRKGDWDAAAKKILDTYPDAFDAAKDLGISIRDLTGYLTGASDTLGGTGVRAAKEFTDQLAKLNDGTDLNGAKATEARLAYERTIGTIDTARKKYLDLNGSVQDQTKRQDDVAAALQDTQKALADTTTRQEDLQAATDRTNDAFDRMSDAVDLDAEFHRFNTGIDDLQKKVADGTGLAAADIDDLKRNIIDLAKDAHANPVEVQSTLDKIDRGDLAGVKSDAERYYAANPIRAQATLQLFLGSHPNFTIFPGAAGQSAAGFSVGTVNMTLPAGWRGEPLAAAHNATRRHGRYYRGVTR